MATRVQKAQTACPHCGHSPLGPDDERCPHCHAWVHAVPTHLAARHGDAEADLPDAALGTRIGGPDLITSDAEAHPGAAALILALLGGFAGAAGLGLMPIPGETAGYLALAGLDVILALLLLASPGLARPLIITLTPFLVAAWFLLGRSELLSPATIAAGVVPLAMLWVASGEPGPRRRGVALAIATALLIFSGTIRLGEAGSGWSPGQGPPLSSSRLGARLRLPRGFIALAEPEELERYFPEFPEMDPEMAVFPFADPRREVGGLVGVAPRGRYTPLRLAQAFYVGLGGDLGRGGSPLSGVGELAAFRQLPQLTFALPLARGRAARITSIRLLDDRLAVVVVSAPASAPEVLEASRQDVAGGLTFSTASP